GRPRRGRRARRPARPGHLRAGSEGRGARSRADRAEVVGSAVARWTGRPHQPDRPALADRLACASAMAATADRPRSAEDVQALVEERDIRFVRLWFTDILGQLKSFSIGRDQLPHALAHGMGFDGSSITGFNAIEESDMVAMPDPAPFAILPWRPEEQGVARLFCDVLTPERTPYEGDPRHVLRRALERMRALGFDTFHVGAEPEYFLFKDRHTPQPLDEGGYFDLTTLDAGSDQ